MHEFVIDKERYGEKSSHTFDMYDEVLDEDKIRIGNVLSGVKKFFYVYDFGDDWVHEITVRTSGPPKLGKLINLYSILIAIKVGDSKNEDDNEGEKVLTKALCEQYRKASKKQCFEEPYSLMYARTVLWEPRWSNPPGPSSLNDHGAYVKLPTRLLHNALATQTPACGRCARRHLVNHLKKRRIARHA